MSLLSVMLQITMTMKASINPENSDENDHGFEWPSHNTLQAVTGAVLLGIGTVLLIPLSAPSSGLPSPVASLGTVLLAVGAFVVGLSTRGRSVRV